ncbi:MAG: hypothetical protein IJ852_06855 [Alphaproteobacteria bacterium]|nr:hypothetical protein [Alphaproteobacteria bacterium]
MKKLQYLFILSFFSLLSACSSSGKGQVIYHWERENTGVAKFSRDHSECLKEAESWLQWPNIANWFYSEEYRYDIHVDWHKEKGIWSSYVPHRGAQPLLVNSIRDNSRSDPRTYRLCMEKKGYWHRQYDLPTVTNVYVYRPQRPEDNVPFGKYNYY